MFFSCSGATRFSEIGFESESPVLFLKTVLQTHTGFRCWTIEAGEGYVSSSFLGTELSTFTLLPERSVRKTL